MTAAELLRAAKAKIEDPEHWCQGSYACDENGNGTYSRDSRAHSWCAVGALFSMAQNFSVTSNLRMAALEQGYRSISYLNDESTHENVMKMYDRAIEFAEKE